MRTLDLELLTSEFVKTCNSMLIPGYVQCSGTSWSILRPAGLVSKLCLTLLQKGGPNSLFCVNDPCVRVHHDTCD